MKKPNRAYLLLATFILVYLGLSIFMPTDPNVLARYNLTHEEVRNLRLGIAVPYALIWTIAFVGSKKLKDYSSLIINSKDGIALSKVSTGLLILASGLAMSAILSQLLGGVNHIRPDFVPYTTVINVYADLVIGLLAMGFIFNGARQLVGIVDKKAITRPAHLVMIVWAIIGVTYVYLTFTNSARQFPDEELGRAAYYLPDFLLLLTVVIPFLAVWYMGLHAAHYILAYRKKVIGVVYRSALGYLAAGLVLVILSRIVTRHMTSLNTVVAEWSLSYILTVIYILLLIIGLGFVLIAKGTKKLKRIEEV